MLLFVFLQPLCIFPSQKSQDGIAIQGHNLGILLTWIDTLSILLSGTIHSTPFTTFLQGTVLFAALHQPEGANHCITLLQILLKDRPRPTKPHLPLNTKTRRQPVGVQCWTMAYPRESELGLSYRLFIL